MFQTDVRFIGSLSSKAKTFGEKNYEYGYYITRPWVGLHEEADEHKVTMALLFAPIPGLAWLGGVGRSLRWMNTVRKKGWAFATSTKWRTVKTYLSIGNLLGTASIVGYYKDKVMQEVVRRILKGEPIDDIPGLLEEEGVPYNDAMGILFEALIYLEEVSRGDQSVAFPGAREIPYSSMEFFSLEAWKRPSVKPARAPAYITSRPSRRRVAERGSDSGSGLSRGRTGANRSRRPPYCPIHKTRHWCWRTRKSKKR